MMNQTAIRILKGCGWGALAIVLLFALLLAVASPVAKYVVNNYGERIIGRQTHVEHVVINPYWGGVTFRSFECKEANGGTNFVAFDRLYVQVAYPQLLGKHVMIRAIHLDGFSGQVLKSQNRLNFSDIIERFSSKDTVAQDTTPSTWTIALRDIRIQRSAIRYRDVESDKQWHLNDISLNVPGLYFDNTQTNAGLEFGLPTGGRVGVIAGYKMQSNRYAVRLNLYDVNTDVVLPLVQDYLNVSGLGAKLNGSVHVDGSLENVSNIQLKGNLSMTGLNISDIHNNPVAAMDELRVVLNRGDLNTNTFILDSLTITGVTGDYEVHEEWNTMSRLLKSEDSGEVSDTIVEEPMPEQTPKPLVWMAKSVRITGHDLIYHDYSMKHKWEYGVKTLELNGTNVATNGRNSVKLNATLTGDAKLNVDFTGGLDLKSQDTRMTLNLKGVNLQDFSPLCRNYTGYSLENGDMTVDSKMEVTSGKLKGENKIVIQHPRVGKKDRLSRAPYKNVPVRMGVSMLTSAQDMIVLNVPVTGDARSPKFNLSKVIGRAVLKVFFGPLMGVNDHKSISSDELHEMQELLGEEDTTSLSADTLNDLSANIPSTASDTIASDM